MATIRPMKPADYPKVAAMADDAARRALVGRPTWESPADITAEVENLTDASFIVAEDDAGQIVGMAGYRLNGNGEAAIYGPLVSAEGHGIGAWLEARIVAAARQEGARSFSMLVGTQNRSGAAWAEWRGYHPESEEPARLLSWIYPGELRPRDSLQGVVLRLAEEADLDQIAALYQECFRAARLDRSHWEELLPHTWVAERDGEIHAFLSLSTGFIRHLCTHPASRRQGLAAALVTHVVQQVWSQRPEKIGIAVSLDNPAGVALIRSLGFRREIPVAKWSKR